ncbi:MAG: hypothetical protein PHC66_02135 [Candidatus Nanoarchaeia archaeon]|nr:hypothetical protein [Candidatus Nanoarchaeia archaeon]MDD5239728.1 hypothetical protein [Candidatus Nanoarchaeia archaeon]
MVLLLVLLLALPVAFASVDVTKTISPNVKANEEFNTTITITADSWTDTLDLHEFTPSGWIVTGWHIDGFDKAYVFYETRDMFYQDNYRTLSHWKFDKRFYGTITVSYQTTPTDTGTYETLTTWTYLGGFDSIVSYINVLPSLTKFPEAAVNLLPEGEKELVIQGFTIDFTVIVTVLIVAGAILFALVMSIAAGKKIAEISSGGTRVPIEDLRTFIKLGLRRGYTLRDMVDALKGGRIDTTYFNEIAKEESIQRMNEAAMENETRISEAYTKRLKSIIERLKG